MPKPSRQQLRVLYLMDYLLSNTDDEHGASINDIINELRRHDMCPNRTTVYSDIEVLRQYGLDIIKDGETKGAKYHIGCRDFQDTELQILVDCIQSSNFITLKKSRELIQKLERQTSRYKARALEKNVYVRNRIKSMEESVYINVDMISTAISGNREISFQYYDYTVQKERVKRHNGKRYVVSPYSFVYVDQNYYLLVYYQPDDAIRHFRVDRITGLEISDTPRKGDKLYGQIDIAAYTTKTFYMFTGTECKVKCRFSSNLVRPVLDRFGNDTIIVPDGENAFTVTLDVIVSPQFFAWFSAFGSSAEILSPENVRSGYARHLNSILDLYIGQ